MNAWNKAGWIRCKYCGVTFHPRHSSGNAGFCSLVCEAMERKWENVKRAADLMQKGKES